MNENEDNYANKIIELYEKIIEEKDKTIEMLEKYNDEHTETIETLRLHIKKFQTNEEMRENGMIF